MALCPEVLPRPSAEVNAMKGAIDNDFKRYRKKVSAGDRFNVQEADTLVLLEGAIASIVELNDARDGRPKKPEDLVIYRTMPGFDCDYCFGGFTMGTFEAVSDSEYLLLSRSAIGENNLKTIANAHKAFVSGSLEPIVVKAMMHDVCGSISSKAVDDFKAAAAGLGVAGDAKQDQKELLKRLVRTADVAPTRMLLSVRRDDRRPHFEGSMRQMDGFGDEGDGMIAQLGKRVSDTIAGVFGDKDFGGLGAWVPGRFRMGAGDDRSGVGADAIGKSTDKFDDVRREDRERRNRE